MNPTDDETWRARVHLAAANRLAVHDGLEEGIDNHFTMCVPGRPDRYLVLPFGLHWSEARASDLIVFNEAGEVLEGSGSLELSALSIHAPLHRITGASVILHTHQTWALALEHAGGQPPAARQPDGRIPHAQHRLRRRLHRPGRFAERRANAWRPSWATSRSCS
jgi:ribulose-5-phosphate 4-epimerase/fuculose-1-phosphate aldolase